MNKYFKKALGLCSAGLSFLMTPPEARAVDAKSLFADGVIPEGVAFPSGACEDTELTKSNLMKFYPDISTYGTTCLLIPPHVRDLGPYLCANLNRGDYLFPQLQHVIFLHDSRKHPKIFEEKDPETTKSVWVVKYDDGCERCFLSQTSAQNDFKQWLRSTYKRIGTGAFYNSPLRQINVFDVAKGMLDLQKLMEDHDRLGKSVAFSLVSSIGAQAFFGCKNLKEKLLLEAPFIGRSAFEQSGIEEVTLLSTDVVDVVVDGKDWIRRLDPVLEPRAFALTPYLKSLDATRTTLKRLPQGLCYGSVLDDVLLPRTLVAIEDQAFQDCRHLERFNFHDCPELEVLGRESFARTDLHEILMGPSLHFMGHGAFSYIPNPVLFMLHWASRGVTLESGVFEGTVPSGTASFYIPSRAQISVQPGAFGPLGFPQWEDEAEAVGWRIRTEDGPIMPISLFFVGPNKRMMDSYGNFAGYAHDH